MVRKVKAGSLRYTVCAWNVTGNFCRPLAESNSFHLLHFSSFPGGECYRDLIHRLTSVVIDLEQQVVPTLVVSHVSILQCLMAYFRNTPVERCVSIEVPMHTVIKFTPVRGGGWSESVHPLYDDLPNFMVPAESESEFSTLAVGDNSFSNGAPIWGDNTSMPNVRSPSNRQQTS